MSNLIQIRNVPDDLHRSAKAQAALEGLSLSEFALRALTEAVSRPTLREIGIRIAAIPPVELHPAAAALIREQRDRP